MTVLLLTYTDLSGNISNIGISHQIEKLHRRATLLSNGYELEWIKQKDGQYIAYVHLDPLSHEPDPFYSINIVPVIG